MTHELSHRYRPTELGEVVGQDTATKTLSKFVEAGKIPHAVLFSGPSGCGKTTMARILAEEIGCVGTDLTEINAADDRGIDPIRAIRQKSRLSPMKGSKARVWIIDEAHQLMSQAQQAFLKTLEEPPSTAYFFLATTEPNKLLPTIRTRCTHIQVRLLKDKEIEALVARVCKAEKVKLSKDVTEKIVECAEGSARKALVILEQVYRLDDEEEQIEAVSKAIPSTQGIELARLLLNPRCRWQDVQKILKSLEDDPETVRQIVLSFMNTLLLSGNAKAWPRAYMTIVAFSEPFFQVGNAAKAALSAACWEVVSEK